MLLKAGGYDLNLFVTISLLILTSSDLNVVLRFGIIVWAALSLSWYAYSNYIHKREQSGLPPALIYFIIFTILSLLFSSIFSGNPIKGLTATSRQFIFFGFAFLIYKNLTGFKELIILVSTVILAGFVTSSGVFYNLITQGFIVLLASEAPIRVTGIFANINVAGGTIAVALLAIFFSFFLKNKKSPFQKLLITFLALFLFVGLVFTNSRAALLTFVLGTTTFILIVYPNLRLKFILSITVFILAVLFIPPVNEFFSFFLRFEKFLNIRDHLWSMSWETIKANPFFGAGPDQFKDFFFKYITAPSGSYAEFMIKRLYTDAGDTGLSHNFFIFRATELGIPGIITALWLPGMFIYFGSKVAGKLRMVDWNGFILVTGALSVGIGLFARGFFESIGLLTHGWLMVDLPFWICFMIILFYYHRAFFGQTKTLKNSPSHNTDASLSGSMED
ncbi:MAG: O-antigen ligase family protein [Ignavibacteriales bacterium]|nr:O-antigen ligase family protein [Ignavibacteriales bacterium]